MHWRRRCHTVAAAIALCAVVGRALDLPEGRVLYCDGNDAYVTPLAQWHPSRIGSMYYASWSPDGKLIAGWVRVSGYQGKVVVMKSDGSGRVDVADYSKPINSYALRVEWAVNGMWDYEVMYVRDRYQFRSVEVKYDGNTISRGAERTVMNIKDALTGPNDGNKGLNGFFFMNRTRLFVRVDRFGWLLEPPDLLTVITKDNYLQYRSGFVQQTCQSSLSPDAGEVQYLQNTTPEYWWPGQKGPHKGFVVAPWTPVGDVQTPIEANRFTLYNTPAEQFGERTIQGCRWSNLRDYLTLVEQTEPRHVWLVKLSTGEWTRLSSVDPGAINAHLAVALASPSPVVSRRGQGGGRSGAAPRRASYDIRGRRHPESTGLHRGMLLATQDNGTLRLRMEMVP